MDMDSNNYEFNDIVCDILHNREFKKLENLIHHKTNRLDHSKRVSFISYKICKKFNFDYVSAARGGMLHDFFTNSYCNENSSKLMKNHPNIAARNAKKHFRLNRMEINIIESHMFPLNFKIFPRYKESCIVSSVDKIICIYEKVRGYSSELAFNLGKIAVYIMLFIFN